MKTTWDKKEEKIEKKLWYRLSGQTKYLDNNLMDQITSCSRRKVIVIIVDIFVNSISPSLLHPQNFLQKSCCFIFQKAGEASERLAFLDLFLISSKELF